MLRVRDIMTRDVQVVSPQTTLREAMEMFARAHVSGAPVVSGQSVVGVVTTSDLLSFAATLSGVPVQREDATELETWNALSAGEQQTLDEADPSGNFFSELWDDAGAAVTERMHAAENPEWNALEEHDVSEVMTSDLWTLPSTADAREAADMMREHGIHRVLIVDDGALVGIVSALDITRATSERKFQTRTLVFPKRND